MNELSVNISGAERKQIAHKAVELFLVTANARHPDENFYSTLTTRIYLDALANMEQYIESPLFPKLRFLNKHELISELCRMRLPDNVQILTLCDQDHGYTKMMHGRSTLEHIDTGSLVVPTKFQHQNKTLFPFTHFGSNTLHISTELLAEIEEYNAKMAATYETLDKQLRTLLQTINQCKTTKAFNAKLSNLTSLFPPSLQTKVNRKNAAETEILTEEQQLVHDATNAIATANLLGS